MKAGHDTMGILPRPAALALLILLGPAGSRASDPEADVHRVYCYFDPAVESQVERARTIHRLTRDLPEVEWIAVTPFPARVPELTTVALPELLSDPSRPGSVVLWLLDRAAGGSDHLLIERQGAGISSGPGVSAPEVIAGAGLTRGPEPSTDISVTTWGKVKDLFQ